MSGEQPGRLVSRVRADDRVLSAARCSGCNRLLLEMSLRPGSLVRKKCDRCGRVNDFTQEHATSS